ncbi:MAG: hypothetical protein ACXWUG_07510 [Polyangiales bacterium]
MRLVLLAMLALACCSKPLPVSSVPEETKPIAAAPLPLGKHRFVMSSSHEISCSQSFETDSKHVTFDLAIDETGHATLKIDGTKSTIFGPAEGKFSAGGAKDIHHESHPFSELWTGSARAIAGGVQLDLAKDQLSWKLACESKRVDAKPPYEESADANATKSVEILSCTPTRHVEERDQKQFGALLFLPLPGLQSSVHDYGWGAEHSELRLLQN